MAAITLLTSLVCFVCVWIAEKQDRDWHLLAFISLFSLGMSILVRLS